MRHAYPKDLASFARTEWGKGSLPALKHLESLLSTCYHASLLREESRPTRFRLIVCNPDDLPSADGPPNGLHRLIFTRPRRMNQDELRRLSPATDFYHCLIGVRLNDEKAWEIWGITHSGSRWAEVIQGSVRPASELPDAPVIHVSGPSQLTFCRGSKIVATLQGGRLATPIADVLDSEWVTRLFAEVRTDLVQLHDNARENAIQRWATLDDTLVNYLICSSMRRMISVMRQVSNGSSILFVPNERAEEFSSDNEFINFKYRFTAAAPRRRFKAILLNVLNKLAEYYSSSEDSITQREYIDCSQIGEFQEMDEALSELNHLIASLTAIDGAVVLSRSFEILGFGAEIKGELADVKRVGRALDVEGDDIEIEATESQGMRHRSVYRICNAVTSIMGLVISHDGEVRFVKHRDGRVTYWNQLGIPSLGV
ncbi:MAG: putative sensor domain DACNV-containing protein [Verrucomicrobiota bacterium]